MNEAQREELRETPWFRHRIVWLVIGIPACTVAGCLLTIYLALTHPDERVIATAPAEIAEDRGD